MDIDYTQIFEFFKTTNWKDFFMPLLGAGFGSWTAYKLSTYRENVKLRSEERALLIKLLYDLNISAKTVCCYYNNVLSEIKSLSKKTSGYEIPISLSTAQLNLDNYGFIAKISPKLYETLTYVKEDIDYIINDNEILIREIDYPSKDYRSQLYSILTTIPKLTVKLYDSLLNVNSFLMKYYKTEDLLKDHVLNAIRRINKVIHITKIYYARIISSKKFKSQYLDKDIVKSYRKLLKAELNYLNEILDTWILDFK